MSTTRSHLVSEEEFLALPQSVEKVELIDGEVIVSPSPSFRHQEVLRRIVVALSAWAAGQQRPVTIAQAPMDVRFGDDRILQPDAFVILGAVPLDTKGPIRRVPEICIEVLSADRTYDRVTKRLIYAASGVQEYWVIEGAGYVERWMGPALTERTEVEGKLTSSLLTGFELDVQSLLAG